MNYYLAGYYLIKPQPLEYGRFEGQEILTASQCINSSLLTNFSRSWTSRAEDILFAQSEYHLDLETLSSIHEWTDQKDAEGKIGYINVFSTLEAAQEYHQKFFSHLDQVKLLGLYLPEPEADRLIEEFAEVNRGDDGIRRNVIRKEREPDKGKEMGFDLVGLGPGGGFHTFHCHHMADFLEEEFKVQINELGLIDTDSKWQQLSAYMNDENSAVEPDPWYFTKVKLFEKI